MKIAIVYGSAFPYSSLASAEHILSYSKSLVKLGNEVTVLSLQPNVNKKKLPQKMPQVNGIYEGVNYMYPAGTVYWPMGRFSFLKKMAIRIRERKGLSTFLCNNDISVVVCYSPTVVNSYYLNKSCKKAKLKFVVERTELPDIYKSPQNYKTLFKRIYANIIKWSFSLPDAWILETKTLQNYYEQYAKQSASFYILPMTVEIERFSMINYNKDSESEYIAYCGNMREDDGISILIKAFYQISEKYPELRLKLAGYSNDTPLQKELVKQLGIENRVEFLGKISREVIPDFLGNAKLLALASPTSLRSCATMPCKVGEYLCTGVPVVVTGLGEINNYLTDGESAYLAQPDSDVLFAQKIDEALSDDMQRRNQIVENGKKVALTYFSASSQANKLLNIFNDIIQN